MNSVIVSMTAVCQVSKFKTEHLNNVLLEPFSPIPIYCRPRVGYRAKYVTRQTNIGESESKPTLGDTNSLVGNGLKISIT